MNTGVTSARNFSLAFVSQVAPIINVMLANAVRRKAFVFSLVVTLAAISAVAMSPEHGEELLTGQSCAVCVLRHSPVLQPASMPLFVPVDRLEWKLPAPRPAVKPEPLYSVSPNRAPPA